MANKAVVADIFDLINPLAESEDNGATSKSSIQEIRLDKLVAYPNQPFRPYAQEKLEALAEDISQNGVLSPILVRALPDGNYQILAGHNRVAACRMIDKETIPSIVKEVDDDEAALIMVNTNLNQRDELLPSEKAFAYKIQMDAMKQQGKRNDLTSYPMDTKLSQSNGVSTLSPLDTRLDAGKNIAELSKESRANIFRYIRLTYLTPSLLNIVDSKELPFRAGVNLSYLSNEQQQSLEEYIREMKVTIDLKQSEQIKAICSDENVELTVKVLDEVFGFADKPKPAQSEFKQAIKSVSKMLEPYFADKSKAQIEETIIKAVKLYLNC